MSEQIQTEDKVTWLGFQDIPETEKYAALAAIRNPSGRDELYRQWSRKAYWRPEEAVALLVLGGVPPEFVEGKLYKVGGADFISAVEQSIDNIERRFGDKVDPKELIVWADEQGIAVPPELRTAFPSAQPKSRESDQRRAEHTLLKILIAMAVDRYGYTNKPNSAAKQIAGAAEDIGLSVTDDTIRNILERATDLAGFDWANIKAKKKP